MAMYRAEEINVTVARKTSSVCKHLTVKSPKKLADGVQIKFPACLKQGQFAGTNRRKIAAGRTEVVDLISH